MSSLPRELRTAEISEFIKFWCEKEQAVIDSRAWRILMELDYQKGAFRMLNGLLHKAKQMMVKEYGITISESGSRSPVFVSMDFIEKAKERLGISASKAAVSGAGIRKELAWKLAVWISYSCEHKKTYDLIKGPKGGTMAIRAFKKDVLAEFKNAFSSSEEAWNFFFKPEALKILNSQIDLAAYIDSLDVKKTGSSVDDIFHFNLIQNTYKITKEQWLAERAVTLAEILIDPGNVKSKFINEMSKLK